MRTIPTKTTQFFLFAGTVLLTAAGIADDCVPSLIGTQPNLMPIVEKPAITGHVAADTHIRTLAESRGYQVQPHLADETSLAFPYSIHKCVAPAWRQLRQAAADEGFELSIVSGYRSLEKQRQIFLSKMGAMKITAEHIALGEVDDKIYEILEFSSIPGYSRHHSGFTLDIQDHAEGLTAFGNSAAYRWISADNFKAARQFGFVPSYPKELPGQGPIPEPWEFIWVGDMAHPDDANPEFDDHNSILSSAHRIVLALDNRQLATEDTQVSSQPATAKANVDETLPGG